MNMEQYRMWYNEMLIQHGPPEWTCWNCQQAGLNRKYFTESDLDKHLIDYHGGQPEDIKFMN